MAKIEMNAREKLEAASQYISMQEEDFCFRLRSPLDALKLWEYSQTREGWKIPEMCDSWEHETYIKVIGYNPWKE